MRKQIRLLLLLALPMLLGLAACSDKDIASFNNPLGSDIYGLWYADYQASGTVGGDNTPYSRVVQAVKFNSDGTGTWWKMMFAADDASKPLALLGGCYPEDGTFDYTVAADGTITAKRRGEKQLDGSPMTLTFHFADGVLTTQDGGATQTLAVAPKDYDNVLLALENSMGGAAADNYNINDKDITAENWRQTEAIYIYDGVGTDVKDEKGRTGYTTVNLPWYNGTKQTNLPEGFCDDITPEMGWEWVANYCGSRSVVNNNFFALYNKYTGILRFFYYMPQGTDTGNDHVWQVSMTDNLATHTTIPYGVPNDRTITNKAAINQTGQGTYMDYITPWVDYRSNDGLIVPNDGWWAFDVDLSLTRPETISNDDNIKLQMRSWDTNHTSLYSTILANIDGEMKGSFEGQTKTPLIASSSKGIFGRVGDLVKLGTKVKDAVTNLYSGNVVGAIKGGVDLAKNGASLASGKTKASGGATSGTFDGTFDGTINMMMNGTINTDGVIQGSQPTVGVASPTFYLKDFDTKSSHLGQGVWNLKKTPVVYRTNYINIEWSNAMGMSDEFLHGHCLWYFFDPSSIEVELNPNVFPEDEIEWMQVDALCGVRSSMRYNGTDSYLKALGIGKNEIQQRYEVGKIYIDDCVPDFLLVASDEMKKGLNYPICFEIKDDDIFNKDTEDYFFCGITGRGTKEYLIEPTYSLALKNYGLKKCKFKTPAYEVNVTVTVKLKNTELPFTFNRIYLPEIQNFDINNLESKIKEIESKKNLSPKTNGHQELYDYQIKRLKEIHAYCSRGFIDDQNF